MKKYLPFLLLGLFALTGCEEPGLTADAVKSNLTGTYCSADRNYQVELSAEGRYEAKRVKKSPFDTGRLGETCEGEYSLEEMENGDWMLVLNKSDKKSNPLMKSCAGEMLVWSKEEGYVMEGDKMALSEPFDQGVVTKGACSE